jgi:osmotically inducible protein OsmC
MTEINRKAGVIWHGDLRTGSGVISTESQALFDQPYSYKTRFEEQPGTNPEELLAAAHSACFSMALASVLKKKGFEPHEIETNATCTVESRGEGFEISRMQLHVRGEVPGVDQAAFRQLVMETDRVCPVSNLLREGLEIQIDAELIMPVPH